MRSLVLGHGFLKPLFVDPGMRCEFAVKVVDRAPVGVEIGGGLFAWSRHELRSFLGSLGCRGGWCEGIYRGGALKRLLLGETASGSHPFRELGYVVPFVQQPHQALVADMFGSLPRVVGGIVGAGIAREQRGAFRVAAQTG